MDPAIAVWARLAESHEIHNETYEFTRKNMSLGNRPFSELNVEQAREQFLKLGQVMSEPVNFAGQETEIIVPSPHDPKGIPISVYKPQKCAETPAIFIFFHGGGLVVGSRQYVESALKIIAMEAGAIIVNVEFRLLPLAHAPCAPFDDGDTVTRWVMANKTAVGGREGSALGVGGDSGGGHIAASITNEIIGLDFQILVYAKVDTSLMQKEFMASLNNPVNGANLVNWVFEKSIKHMPNFTTDPRINPMVRTNTELTPPTLIILAELDPGTVQGQDYAKKLRAAGVSVQCEIIRGVPHGFVTFNAVFKTKAAEAYEHIAKFLKKFSER